MSDRIRRLVLVASVSLIAGVGAACARRSAPDASVDRPSDAALVAEGRDVFRFDTFGDEAFWTDTARLHEVIATSVSPKTALQVGLKVDAEALPREVRDAIAAGEVDLDDPATTVTLLRLGAVVGVIGSVSRVGGQDRLTSVGITCAICHSTVDDSFAPGIGARLDGWPNRSLDVGAIIALSPAVPEAQKAVYRSWGPGMYDPRFNFDGQSLPVVIPPAFGLAGVRKEIYTADDTISYWNAYVAVTQMHGVGRFVDPRLGISVDRRPDRVTPKLDALRAYQHSLPTPPPAAGSFDVAAAERGRALFDGVAGCATCHIPGESFTDVNRGRLHTATEAGQSAAYAERSVTRRYRATPLRALWRPPHLTGPYFHDGSAASLDDVVGHYVQLRGLSLTAGQRADLVEYLKTL